MRQTDISSALWAMPDIRALYKHRIDLVADAKAHIPSIVAEITASYDFPFTYSESTETVVVGTRDYTLEGEDGDCRDIILIKYGDGSDNDVVLDKKSISHQDRREGVTDDDTTDDITIEGYAIIGEEDHHPKIRLSGKPSETGKVLTYRYRKSDIKLTDISDVFRFVVIYGVAASILPSIWGVYDRALNKMISRYTVGGDSYDTVRLDPVIEAGNLRRAGSYGEG